jgi:esterase/lipase superfamily enzyme
MHKIQAFGATFIVAIVATYGQGDYAQAQSNSEKPSSTSTADQSLQRTVPFITFRNKTGSSVAEDYFGDDRSIRRAGYCGLTRTPLKILQPIADSSPFYIPDEIVTLDSIQDRSINNFWSDLQANAATERPVLYTHGYFMDFERSCKRASMLQYSLGLASRFMLVSWPSDGAILNYTRDESDLYWSVAPLAETLTEMVARFGAGNFDVVSHSLGTRGVFLALVYLAGTEPHAKPWINQLVLLAADIDIGVFKQYLPQIKLMAENITIYVSGNDQPLALSRQIHGRPRLGERGSHLESLAGVDIIDLSEIPVRYPSGHVYHLFNRAVSNDLAQLLDSGKPASQRANMKKVSENYWLLQPEIDGDDS